MRRYISINCRLRVGQAVTVVLMSAGDDLCARIALIKLRLESGVDFSGRESFFSSGDA
jgi:hypothetical protein